MQLPVTSSHSRRPHSHAAEETERGREVRGVGNSHIITRIRSNHLLTSAVGKAVVSRGTLRALSTDDMRPAGTLSSDRITSGPCGAGLVTAAGQSSVIIGCRKRAG